MIKFLDLYSQYQSIKSEIDAAIQGVIESSTFIGGPPVRTFEKAFGAYQEAEYCVGVGNCTDGLEISLQALALPAGSEVIVPANTFIATSEAVTRCGHKVVFADIDPDTYTLSMADVRSRINERTGAIIAVHLYGHPSDMAGLDRIRQEYGLKVIEDCAQAHGAMIDGRKLGALGDVGTFSFYPGKNLGAYGDAGAITTNDEAIAKRCRMIANHGRIDKYDHQFEGRNSRLDSLQAAILKVKLGHLDEWIDARNRVAAEYTAGLSGIGDLVLPHVSNRIRHAFHLYVVRSERRDELAGFLRERGIQTGIHYPIALPKLAAYTYLGQANDNLAANKLDSTLLSLPIGEHLSSEQTAQVIDTISSFFSH